MIDQGAVYTDKELAKMEKKIKQIYSEAQSDIEDKIAEFNKKFYAKQSLYQQKLKDGEITQEQYDQWLRGQVFQSKQWESKKDQIIGVIQNANKEAANILNGGTISVFAENANWSHYQMEQSQGVNFGFGLYDAQTVTNLIKNDPQVLPKWKINEPKDYIWNSKKVNNSITQGIIQGEGLDKIAKRLANSLSSNNKNTMLTFARTAMTGAQNAGRYQSQQDAKELGIDIVKVWMSTLDKHTRVSHQELDGEEQKVGDKWHPFKFSNGCRYPGDPQGPPHEVYNCRCTLVSDIKDYPSKFNRYDNIDGKPIKNMSYKEWKKAKSYPKLEELHLKGVRSSIGDEYANAMETVLNFTEEEDVKDLFYKFGDSLKVTDSNMEGCGAYFDSGDGGVHMNASGVASGDDVHVAYQTAFHEFAHNIDWVAGNERGAQWVSRSYKNGLLGSTIKSDFDEYAKRFVMENPHSLFQDEADFRITLRDMGRNIDEKFTTMARAQRRGEISIEEILGQYGDDISNYILSNDDNKTWVYDKIIESLKSESMPMTTSGSLSDMLEYCTGNPYPLGVGHGKEYWGTMGYKDDGSVVFNDREMAPLEFFAEVCDGKASNPKSLEQMRRVFPNAVKVVEDIIKEITK